MTCSEFRWPKNGTVDQKTFSLIWATPSMLGVDNFGGGGWVAVPNGRETDPVAGARFRPFGKRRRCMAHIYWE